MFRRAFLRTLKRLISCLFVLWSITVFILILRRWDIFSSPKSVFVYQCYKLQTCVVKLKLRTIFLCFFLVCSRNWCFYNYHHFRCFILLQGHQRERHICFFFQITEFISRMQAFNVSNYFSHSYVPLTRLKRTCGVKVKKTQLSENIFAYLFGDSS